MAAKRRDAPPQIRARFDIPVIKALPVAEAGRSGQGRGL